MFESNKSALSVAMASALGLGGLLAAPAGMAVPAGNYIMVINTTPTGNNTYGTFYKPGKDGAWNSTFTFGGLPGLTSQGMTDNGVLVSGLGTSIAGDGYAGRIVINVASNGAITVSSFNVDTIFATAGGDFAQYLGAGGTSGMSGNVDGSGNMTFTPTGRRGSINAPNMNADFNINNFSNPGSTTWQSFSTGSATSNQGTINGAQLSVTGDLNGDGIDDYQGVLVSGGHIGSDWGDFFSAAYYETWNVNLLSATTARADTASVNDGGSVLINVLVNDSGPGLTITAVTNGTLGTVTNNTTNVTYTSTGGTGADSFTYTVQGSDGISSTVTVNVTVASAGIPIANDDTATTTQGTPVSFNVTANDSDPGGSIDVTTVVPVSPSVNGGIVTDNNDGTVTYDPAGGFVGVDTFTYTVDDNDGNTSSPATVTVTVNAAAQTSAGTIDSFSRVNASALPDDGDVSQSCIGGCFEFEITGAANPTSIVLLPLNSPIQSGYVYRKLIDGTWRNFDTTTTGDTIASAPKTAGDGCPTPADGSWVVWAGASATADHAGHECVRLTIADNGVGDGPNDANPAAGTIADPGGLAIPAGASSDSTSPILNSFASNTGGGCTLSSRPATGAAGHWLLIGGLLAALGLYRRKRLS